MTQVCLAGKQIRADSYQSSQPASQPRRLTSTRWKQWEEMADNPPPLSACLTCTSEMAVLEAFLLRNGTLLGLTLHTVGQRRPEGLDLSGYFDYPLLQPLPHTSSLTVSWVLVGFLVALLVFFVSLFPFIVRTQAL